MLFPQIVTAATLLGSLVSATTAPDEIIFDILVQEEPPVNDPTIGDLPHVLAFGVDNREHPLYQKNYTVYQRIHFDITHPNGTHVFNQTLEGYTETPCTSMRFSGVGVEHKNATGQWVFF
jgi:hypothetical protein